MSSKPSETVYQELLWAEKYRPRSLSEIVNQEDIVSRLRLFVKGKNMPHLLFAGPPGTGKCVTYDTLVLTDNGPRKIGEIIEKIIRSKRIAGEEVFEKAVIPVYSLSKDGKIIPARTSHIYRGKTKSIVEIELSSGRRIEVTPKHPLLVMNMYGKIEWKLPSEINNKMKIAVPKTIDFKENKVNEKDVLLAELLGYLLADGNIYINPKGGSSYIAFHNNNSDLRSRVKLLFRLTYGVEAREEFPRGRTPRIRVNRKEIVEDIARKSGLHGRKARIVRIPAFVWKSRKTLAAFLRAYTDADGTVEKIGILITTASKDMAFDLLYAFNIFGIIARLKEEKTSENTYYNITISGQKQLKAFMTSIGLLHPKKKNAIIRLLKRNADTNVDTIYIPQSLRRILPKLNKHLSRRLTRAEKRLILEKERMSVETFNNLIAKILPDLQKLLIDIEERLGMLRNPVKTSMSEVLEGLNPLKVSARKGFRVFEYKNRQRIPRLDTVAKLLDDPRLINSLNEYRNTLGESIRRYLSYDSVGRRFHTYGSSVMITLQHNIRVNRLEEPDQLRQVAWDELMNLYKEIAEAIYDISSILRLNVFWDDINSIRIIEKETVVYDLTVPDCANFIGGYGPVVLHNTTSAHALAHDLYGEDYRMYMLELNASVTQETLLPVRIDGDYELITFRELDREYFRDDSRVERFAGGEYVKVDNLEVITFDKDAHHTTWGRVKYLVRHRAPYILKVGIRGMGHVELTGNHSVITLSPEGYVRVRKASDLAVGDRLISLANTSWILKSDYSPGKLRDGLRVVKIERIDLEGYDGLVYDVSVPGNETFFAGDVPILLHNSDERGIDIIRTKVKEFARSKLPANVPFKIVLLDEADNMTADAQQALRRLMEMYVAVTRFILIANYPSKIIEPIQSRCAVFRFTPLKKEDVVARLSWICEREGIKCRDDALETIYEISEGDMRKAINILQSAGALGGVTVSNVYKVVGLAHPREVRQMISVALSGDFLKARDLLRGLMTTYGLSGTDIVKQIHREIFSSEVELPEDVRVELADYVGEIQYRIVEGADDEIQLNALLARFALVGNSIRKSRK